MKKLRTLSSKSPKSCVRLRKSAECTPTSLQRVSETYFISELRMFAFTLVV